MGQKGEKKTEKNTLKSKIHPSLFVNARRHICKGEGTISEDVCVCCLSRRLHNVLSQKCKLEGHRKGEALDL